LLFEIVGSFLSGLFGSMQNLFLFPLVLSVYAVANCFWLIALRNGSKLARGSVYFGVGFLLCTMAIGFLLYEEKLTSLKLVGMLLGVISLVLMTKE
jgi:multidrug transporter EmrE-like cation transporter